MTQRQDWWVYEGTGTPHDGIRRLPPAPPWRAFRHDGTRSAPLYEPSHVPADDAAGRRHLGRAWQGAAYQAGEKEIHLVNLALHLRRPLLLTGKPGTGKSTLAYAVAHELKLGPVLRWSVTSRSTLKDGLYEYDAVGRLYDAGLRNTGVCAGSVSAAEPPDIGKYLSLGPLGTALLNWPRPRVLLIDEIDKSDMDFPNDLLNVFEEGEFAIPELARLGDRPQEVVTDDGERAVVRGGEVACTQFPFVVLTSNEEREFPMAFLRRCIRLKIGAADPERLAGIVAAHLGAPEDVAPELAGARTELIARFLKRQREVGVLANDQLLNALLMAERGLWGSEKGQALVLDDLLRPLDGG
ncbi:MoxR family ATPase [Streptomyces sp. NBC_00075]|uniref:MoxR family ATPase n=1 Tax=Streptomyces sp. NBC_00093 TaxID=2975649 RepID=A0AAU2A3E6_9ACTN